MAVLYTCLTRTRLPLCFLCRNIRSASLFSAAHLSIASQHYASKASQTILWIQPGRTLHQCCGDNNWRPITVSTHRLLGEGGYRGASTHRLLGEGGYRGNPTVSPRRRLGGRQQQQYDKHDQTALIYICAIGVFMLGLAYAGVPLYRMFCQAKGGGGQAIQGQDTSKVENMTAVKERVLRIRFNADTASSMQWNFKPQQSEVQVLPGETALAFYTAKNPTDKAIIGISTYSVIPFEAGQYFNKIQCFCFEEQRLNPHEEVDMPVFFYIDPEIMFDPKLELLNTITLSYTFFEAKEGMSLPLPGYPTRHS